MEKHKKEFNQKSLLYSFDKKVDLLFRDYFKFIFSINSSKQNTDTILKQLEELQLQNLIYKVAFSSADQDLNHNEQEQIDLQYQIDNCKLEIKELQQEYKIKRQQYQNKRKYNQIGEQLKRFDKLSNFDLKMTNLIEQLKKSEERFNQDMKKFEQQKQLLRVSHSALMTFCKLSATSNKQLSSETPKQFSQKSSSL